MCRDDASILESSCHLFFHDNFFSGVQPYVGHIDLVLAVSLSVFFLQTDTLAYSSSVTHNKKVLKLSTQRQV